MEDYPYTARQRRLLAAQSALRVIDDAASMAVTADTVATRLARFDPDDLICGPDGIARRPADHLTLFGR